MASTRGPLGRWKRVYVTALCVLVAVAVMNGDFTFAAKVSPGETASSYSLSTIQLRLYGRLLSEYKSYFMDTQSDELVNDPLFDRQKPTVLYIHGYMEVPDAESIKTVMSALMSINKYNLILVDYSKIANNFYLIPALMVPAIGLSIAKQLDKWHEGGIIPLSNVYIVGHSLGGQVSGFVGKNVRQGKIPRITALDPAYPGFFVPRALQSHLSPTDADFVDVIHTDGGFFGVAYPTGSVDFYPNAGLRLQPGCPAGTRLLTDDDFCSHWRSWRFFAESLNPALPPFEGTACKTAAEFNSGACDNNEKVVMGYYTPTSARGTFYMRTSNEAPFAMGPVGARSAVRESPDPDPDPSTTPSMTPN